MIVLEFTEDKFGKAMKAISKIGEHAECLQAIFEDLSEDAKKITAPTLLIWGTYDTEAPINEAKELEGIMKDAALIELPGTHYAYIENLDRVCQILDNFF
jgi:pimeloyl-ACP methyl ester carboxylesterase